MGNASYKKRHKELGLCLDCSQRATHGCRCEIHWINTRLNVAVSMKRLRSKHKENGECIRCGKPLHDEMDAGYAKCLTCREKMLIPTTPNRRVYDTSPT